ncbi:hypothetical protein MMC29_003308 [Sticta canariensis]|nr:hypothetical protein [Sticta canariensis]
MLVRSDSKLGRLGWHSVFTSDGAPLHNDASIAFRKTTYVLEVLYLLCAGLNKISVLLFYKRIFFIDRPFRIVVWCFIGLCTAWMIAFEFALTVSCVPIAFRWNPNLEGTCVGQTSLLKAALSTDVITDDYLAPLYYWSIVQINTGILSACLPTFRPLLEAYPPSSLLSMITRPFSSVFRPIWHSSADVRLDSVEHGLNEVQSKDLAVYQRNARAMSADSSPPS